MRLSMAFALQVLMLQVHLLHPPIIATATSVDALLSEIGPVASVGDSVLNEDNAPSNNELLDFQDKQSSHNEECCSYTSSNRESWGRCSSLGGSDEESSADRPAADNNHQKTFKVFATPLRNMKHKLLDSSKEEKRRKKEEPTVDKKPKGEKREKLEAFTLRKRLRLCILKQVKHRRHSCSS